MVYMGLDGMAADNSRADVPVDLCDNLTDALAVHYEDLSVASIFDDYNICACIYY